MVEKNRPGQGAPVAARAKGEDILGTSNRPRWRGRTCAGLSGARAGGLGSISGPSSGEVGVGWHGGIEAGGDAEVGTGWDFDNRGDG